MHRIALFLLLLTATIHAQHHNGSAVKTDLPVDLGTIDFPNSGPPEAQKQFIEGVLLLHSFEYARSRRAFQEAVKIAPEFALAYWCEAMTYDHRIWGEQDQLAALAALKKLAPTPPERRAKAKTEREKMYLDAVEALFGESEDPHEIAAAYSNAMAALTKRFPDDLEAQALYSLSLLGLTGTVRNTENYMRAAAVAEAVFQKNPRHPGALHYLIHSYDDPVHAPLGLRAARAYGEVARSASHAQHMPSHIFFALGLWEDSIAANTASMKTARDEATGGYHALHWLQHSYLQIGREDEAAKLLAVIEEDAKTNTSPYNRTHLALCRATMLVETRGKGPATMMSAVETSGIRSFSVFANHDLAIGLEHVRRNELADAKRVLGGIRARKTAGAAAKSDGNISASRYLTVSQADIDTLTVMEQILDASIRFATADRDEALRQIVAAAEAEDKLVFEYGPPAIVKPAWEAAGEMMLAAGRKTEAAEAFRKALKRYPNRRLSNEGLKAATARTASAQ
jgi:tetratricopeptide (TPR) repeat protein